MQELKTRSARHHRPKRKMVINKKAIAPLTELGRSRTSSIGG